ncbi:hypothetical protein K5E_11180 [Enterococcus thailandicus]|uniref:hypothetical protein n=1 Tax=Enterococcus thailandicus TaxID=417368 RepID=UPI00244D96B6|nr:hypothetical protein [Enterococcus thailandicus]GMC02584.1 hypothetical protein K4E_00940 [Enterococcus thailandicus]GMC08979.1 hypothetical protein K5E_11180 [Enterococcus thailandicus]
MEIKIKATTAVTLDKKVRYAVMIEEDGVYTASSISKDREIIFEQNNNISEQINTISCLRYAIWYLNKEMYDEPLALLTEQKEIVEYLNKQDYAVTEVDILNRKVYGLKKMLEENKNVKVSYFNPEEDKSYQEFLNENFPSSIPIKPKEEQKVDDDLMEKMTTIIIDDDDSDIDEEDLFYQIENG